VGHPIVTNGDFVAFSAVRGGDAALPKVLWDFFFSDTTATLQSTKSRNQFLNAAALLSSFDDFDYFVIFRGFGSHLPKLYH